MQGLGFRSSLEPEVVFSLVSHSFMLNLGALIIQIGFGGMVYQNYNKDPHKKWEKCKTLF